MATCKNHPGISAVGRCVGCAEEFCHNCLIELEGQKYCGSCKVMALGGKTPAAAVELSENGTIVCKTAKESMSSGIVGLVSALFCFHGVAGILLGPLAILKAFSAYKMIKADPLLAGRGKADAGLITGVVATVYGIIAVAAMAGSI